eukprot:TRINITY_DN9571_c0_g1_i11.p1 TRINITY_DN9571_c0_g1~~TRINITY_DN9571_c0_g1_i11.p1  ORF type:complete len:285 (-),score=30.85 TRINITY_DN9571_c0_g1_i11:57-911(-)
MIYSIDPSAPIIDYTKAITDLGDKELFIGLVGIFDENFVATLEKIKTAVDSGDNTGIRMHAHTLKGTASYIQAERVRRISEILQLCIDNNEPENVFKYYPLLIKESIKLRRAIRQYLCENNSNGYFNRVGEEFAEDEKDFDIPISQYFQLKNKDIETFDVILAKKSNCQTVLPISDKGREGKAEESKERDRKTRGKKPLQIVPAETIGESTSKNHKDKRNETVEKCSCLILCALFMSFIYFLLFKLQNHTISIYVHINAYLSLRQVSATLLRGCLLYTSPSPRD